MRCHTTYIDSFAGVYAVTGCIACGKDHPIRFRATENRGTITGRCPETNEYVQLELAGQQATDITITIDTDALPVRAQGVMPRQTHHV